MIPFHSHVGPVLKASKWQKVALLVEVDEMKALLSAISPLFIIKTSGLIKEGEEIISNEEFLDVYSLYLSCLKKGEEAKDPRLNPYFSSIWTVTPDVVYGVKIKDRHSLVKLYKPAVQLQGHRFNYSTADQTFRSMVFGVDSISWGLQFSYPHLYQDDEMQAITIKECPDFPNTSLFKKIQQWARNYTIPTPIVADGKRVNVPFRLGKECLSWVHNHPQLRAKNLIIPISGIS